MAHTFLSWTNAVLLGFGIFPSWVALSSRFAESYPKIFRFTGPINPLKLGLPLILYFLWVRRKAYPKKLWLCLLVLFIFGTFATLIAGQSCLSISTALRPWSVMVTGTLACLALFQFSRPQVKFVLIVWASAVFGSAFLGKIAPSSTLWLYENIFDVSALQYDFLELGSQVLTGVYGRQSLAKFLTWLPWLLTFFWIREKFPDKKTISFQKMEIFLFGLGILSTALILATSQRGPFLSALLGWVAFALHQYFQLGGKKLARLSAFAIGIILVLTLVVVPRNILEPRIRSLFGLSPKDFYGQAADTNRDFRLQVTGIYSKIILENPLGKACVPEKLFLEKKIIPGHSHNLFLQQFVERGWIWGLIHLALWLLAWLGAWRVKSFSNSLLFGGLSACIFSGLFDHPWFVLNHALILSTYLYLGILSFVLNRYQSNHKKGEITESGNDQKSIC